MSEQAHPGSLLAWRSEVKARPRGWTRSIAFACGLAFAGTLAIALLQGPKRFWGDSSEYWGLGATFTVNGHFSLLNFTSPRRGYFLPLVNHGLAILGSDLAWTSSSLVKLTNALTFALVGAVLGPALIRTVWPTQPSWGAWRRLTLTGLLVVFWSGFLNFPLSDFPGLALALLTLVAVARTDSPAWMLIAGVALGAAVDVRAAYLPLAPAVAALVVWAWWNQRGRPHASVGRRGLCVGLLVLGFAVVSLPQSLATHRHYGIWNFVPSAPTFEPAGTYLTPGMYTENQDTYVNGGPRGGLMVYLDPAGLQLLEEQPRYRIASTSQYIELFLTHPLVMGGLVVGHIVNSMDPLYSTPYIEHLHNAGRTWGRIAAFLLLFIALLRVLWPAARRRLGPGRLRYLVALTLCCVTTIPTNMERRYLLPIYLLAYALALTPRWPNPIGSSGGVIHRWRTPAIILVSFALYASVVWYITSEAIDHLRIV